MSQSIPEKPRFPWGILIGIVVVGGAAVFALPMLSAGFSKAEIDSVLTHEVEKDELLITVTEEGNVESASNIDVKCQVAGGSSILWIIPDGEQVKKGDLIVELDSATLEEQINTQRIAFEKARATKIQSEKTFSVAKISVTEYIEGTFKQQLQDADTLVTISEENLRSAKNSLDHAQRMFRKGYVSELELEGAKFAVQRCELELGSSQTAREVLVKFTKEKTLEDLRSQRDNAEAQMKSDASAFELEETRLQRLVDQKENCKIYAPSDGMVVYANERGGRFGQSQATIEEGAAVRERQTILRLPDLSQMQVKVNVHESKVDQLEPGMRARIRILDKELTGTVTSIGNQPEPSSFFSGNVKEYATFVRVSDSSEGEKLRPGMTAEVEILVAHLKDVLTLPVAAVVEQRGQYMAWVRAAVPEKRPLVLGLSNDQYVEVKDGIVQGDQVLLNPRAIVKEAREIAVEEKVDVSERFGDEAAVGMTGDRGEGPGAGGPRGPGGPGAGRREGGGEGGGPRGNREGAGGGGRPGGGGRGGGGLARFDTDGDGKVSKDEVPEQMKGFFDNMDANGDGFIDAEEQAEMRKRFQAGGGGRPGGGGGEGGGPRGGGGGPGRQN